MSLMVCNARAQAVHANINKRELATLVRSFLAALHLAEEQASYPVQRYEPASYEGRVKPTKGGGV